MTDKTPGESRMKVAIATPTRDLTTAIYSKNLAELCLHVGAHFMATGQADFCVITDTGADLTAMRITIAKEAIKQGCTHILWLDSDMAFPKDLLERLFAHGAPIVGASYVMRKRPCQPVAAKNGLRVYTEEHSTGIEEVDYVGAGAMLVDIEVYKNLSQPWYMFGWHQKLEETIGEDVYFCRKARQELGALTFIDHDLTKEISHIGYQAFTYKEALEDRPILLERQKKKAKDAEANNIAGEK